MPSGCSRYVAVKLCVALLACAGGPGVRADVHPHGGMLRYPDVSATHVVFVYANDLWTVPRTGGLASPLASPDGIEAFPRFSPDGQTIAFVGNYDGDTDLYTIPLAGGVPFRVTYHPSSEQLCDWTSDGRLIFHAVGRGDFEFTQLHVIPAAGGPAERLPVPYGGNGAISPDGAWLAYTPVVRDARTWKRYRGGMVADIWLFHLQDHVSRQVTTWEGTDSLPMWHGDKLYFVSDAGPNHRLNIWVHEPPGDNRRQVTHFDEYDVKWPSMGPGPTGGGEIVFQHGTGLYLLDLQTEQARPIDIVIPGDRPTIRPQRIDVADSIRGADTSPRAKRAVLEARGDIWTMPAKEGVPRNLTRTSGTAERDPAWSPDGRWIAWLSDADGEYDLHLAQSDGKGETRKLTDLGPGFRFMRGWSPDSKYIAFGDNAGRLSICAVESGAVTEIDQDPSGRPSGAAWSYDSRWIAYTRDGENEQAAIWVYEVASGARHQLTSGMFNDRSPAFDREGNYLYFTSNRSFRGPQYEDIGPAFVYAETGVLVAVPLRADVAYPWAPKNDEETWEEKPAAEEQPAEEQPSEDKPADEQPAKEGAPDGDEGEKEATPAAEAPADDGVSGVWEGTITAEGALPPEGLPFTLRLRIDSAGAVGGSLQAGKYHGTLHDGTYDRVTGRLECQLDVTTDEGLVTFAMAATISGQSITGTVTGPDFSGSFSGSRTSAELPESEDEVAAKPDEKKDKAAKQVEIEFADFEQRALQLPVGSGYFHSLTVNDKNQLIYVRHGGRRAGGPPEIKLFDLSDEKKEEKTVVAGAGSFVPTADGKKLLVRTGRDHAIVDARPGQKLDAKIPLAGMTAVIDPRAEWEQVFVDTWRIQRDFFYVESMHGVDWPAVRERYRRMLADCVCRDDVAYVISEMIGELNIGHAYYRTGPVDRGPSVSVGMLGVDFEPDQGAYRIARIHEGGPWDLDGRGPLSKPGVDVHVGDYLLAVNGLPLDTSREPWAAFLGLADRTALLTVSSKPQLDDDAREVLVQLLSGEGQLRYRSWVERNRLHVEEQSGGRIGYIHVPDTGIRGQNELFRQFYGQRDREALIIDERWNGGGQIPDRFIELLNRPLLNYWANRHARDGRTPRAAHFGPKCMLINGWAGSGGDLFPALFRQVGLGKLIGRRTWGGLVGMAGNPQLIDGAYVTVPMFGYYRTDGTWGIEGHGVDPDIEVIDDPALMTGGQDPQLDAAIAHLLEELKTHKYVPAPRPPAPDRSGMGVPPNER